jgi:PBP1b-binding outer membrane lipoprotein LpoB
VKKILTALAVATGLLLTGCSNVDAALTIGDTKITTAELQANADIVLAERAKVDTSQMQLETGEVFLRNKLTKKCFWILNRAVSHHFVRKNRRY